MLANCVVQRRLDANQGLSTPFQGTSNAKTTSCFVSCPHTIEVLPTSSGLHATPAKKPQSRPITGTPRSP
eukprot:6202049-Prorocentrum_lima.AAC.1